MSTADWNRLQSKSIDVLRFPMAVAVVMLHYGVRLMLDTTGPLRILCIIFQEGICRLAVPCFFFISGYLFFNNLQEWSWNEWTRKIKSRGRTLVLPYLSWNLIAFFVFWFYARFQGNLISLQQFFFDNGGIRIFWGTNGRIPIGVQAVPIDQPLWFIRDLIVFTLLTPAIFVFFKWTRVYGVLALAGLFLFVPGFISEGFMFYVAGSAFQMAKRNVVESFWSRRAAFYALSVALLIGLCLLFDIEYWRRLVKNLFLFCGIASTFCISADLLGRDKIKIHPFLVRSSFFIFATHEILILQKLAQPLADAVLPSSGWFWPCVKFFLVPALATCICLSMFWLMEKLLPRTTAFLTGNRQVKTI